MSRSDIGQYGIIPRWVLQQANPAAVKVYAYLTSCQRHSDGSITESQANIAGGCALARQTVSRVLRDLETIGALRVERRYGRDGACLPNAYWIADTEGAFDVQ